MNPEDGCWKRIMTPYEMSDWHYKELIVYVESMPDDFQRATFESVSNMEGA